MKITAVILGVFVSAFICSILFTKGTPAADLSSVVKEEELQLRVVSARSKDPTFIETTFKADEGRELWNLALDVRIKIKATAESLENLRRMCQNRGIDPDKDRDFIGQKDRLAQLQKWSSNLERHYTSALMDFEKFRLEPTNETRGAMNKTVAHAMKYGRKILNGQHPDTFDDSEVEADFKVSEGAELWGKIKEVSDLIVREDVSLAKLQVLLERKGLESGKDPDYATRAARIGQLNQWQVVLGRHFNSALLAYEKSRLNLGDDSCKKMRQIIATGILYAQNIIEGEDPERFTSHLDKKVKHSERIVQIWNKLSMLRNVEPLPNIKTAADIFGRADMEGTFFLDVQEAKKSANAHFTINRNESLRWWAYFNGDNKKRALIVYFLELNGRLAGWNWNERVADAKKIGAPKGYADQAILMFRKGEGAKLQSEITAMAVLVINEKKRLNEFGRMLKVNDAEYNKYVQWREAWVLLNSRITNEPETRMREAFLVRQRLRLIQSVTGAEMVRQKLAEGTHLVREIWAEYHSARMAVARP